MSFVVTCLGGAIAEEGVLLLERSGASVRATDPYPSHQDAIAALQDADAAIVRLIDLVDEEMMTASSRLKVISKHGVGTNDIDVAAAARLSIPVTIAAGTNAHSVAEHTLGLILTLAKDFQNQDRHIRAGIWDKKLYRGRELRGQTLGLVGFGHIARLVSAMAQAIGMHVLAYDPHAPADAFGVVEPVRDLGRLLTRSDFISLHCPLTPETWGLIGAKEFQAMKPTAVLINTARGEIVDEPALVAALESGRIAGAGLDSFATEPPDPANRLWQQANTIFTPHVAGVTLDAMRAMSVLVAETVIDAVLHNRIRPELLVRPAPAGAPQ